MVYFDSMKYLFATILFLAVLFLAQPLFVYSNDGASTAGNKEEIEELNSKIEEKQDKIKQLEESIELYKDKIAEKRLESVSLSNQIAILDNRTAQVELDIEVAENKLDTLELEIQSLELGIEDKEDAIGRQQIILGELIRTIHQNSQRSYVEIFAAYDSFSDFYNRIQYLQTVEQDLGRSAQGLRLAKVELEDKRDQKTEVQETFEELREELVEKRTDLQEQADHKVGLLADTQSSELKFQTLVGSLRSQYEAIENEIAGIELEVRRKLEAQDALDEEAGFAPGTLSWPTQSTYITSRFHDPDYPYRHVFEHSGIDIRAGQGTPLKAAASGYVARARHCSVSSCYSYTMLIHSGGLSTVYGHMSAIYVTEDQFVTRGDVIGLSGGTPGTVGAGPFVTGPHLHFEVRSNGVPVDPLLYLVGS